MELAGKAPFVFGRIILSTSRWINDLDSGVPEAPKRFPSPKVPREVLDSRDQHTAVIPATQPPELFGDYPPDWLPSVPLDKG
jgi:hypothetical protein